MYLDPFDCENQPCKWVWLLYDHPYLLNSLLNAKCFNDTILTDLNAEVVWSDCLMVGLYYSSIFFVQK